MFPGINRPKQARGGHRPRWWNAAGQRTNSAPHVGHAASDGDEFLGRIDVSWLYPPYDDGASTDPETRRSALVEREDEDLPPFGLAMN
jgi:hypothetical protein